MTPVLDGPAVPANTASAQHICPECAATFTPHADNQLFCSRACARAFNNLWLKRGGSGIMLATAARATRNGQRASKAGNQTAGWRAGIAFDRKLREWLAEDRAANDGRGRMPIADFLRLRFNAGFELD